MRGSEIDPPHVVDPAPGGIVALPDYPSFAVKCKRIGSCRFRFVGNGGRLSTLRIFALQFPSENDAWGYVNRLTPDNPGHEWKVTRL